MQLGKIVHIILIVTALCAQAWSQGTSVGNDSNLLNDRVITAVAIDDSNNKYLGTEAGLIKVTGEGIIEEIVSGSSITAITADTKAGVWYATSKEVIELNSGRSLVLPEGAGSVTSMDFSGGALWVGTDNGLYVLAPTELTIKEHYTTDNSKLPSMRVEEVFIDRSRVKWIGTDNGIVRIENDKWRVYEKGNSFIAATENAEGVWIATSSEVWLVDPFNRWSPTNATNGLREGDIKALAADKQGNVYILSETLIQFNPYTDITQEIAGDLDISPASKASLAADNNDYLWFGASVSDLQAVNPRDTVNATLNTYAIIDNVTCKGRQDGAIRLEIRGGTRPYTLSWSDARNHEMMARGLAPGDYSVTVTDARRVRKILSAPIEEPEELTATIRMSDALDELKVLAGGGNGGYTFMWMDGNTGVSLEISGTRPLYSVTVTDHNGCTAKAELAVEPTAPSEAMDASEMTAVTSGTLKAIDANTLAVGQTLRIEQLFFEADSAEVKSESFEVLDEIYTFLSANPRISIEIGGHTNGLPDHEYCDRLSTARARIVAEYLYSKGLTRDRISYKGYGKRLPLASNATAEGRRKNQRVEIKILQT